MSHPAASSPGQTFAASLLVGVCVTLSAPAAAQAPDAAPPASEAEEVVVTGQRRAYLGDVPERESPRAITILDADLLDRAGVVRLSEALDLSASIARQNNFGGLWDSFAVRGFVGDENLPSNYLVNGFNGGRGFGGPRDLAGIERVEILKGPNAALFGRGEPGGTVNLVTKRPRFEPRGSFQAEVGSFGTIRSDVDWTGGLTDWLAVRFVGFHETGESFRDTIDIERYGAFPSLLVRPIPDVSLTYELEYTRQSLPFDRGVVALNGRLGALPQDRFLGEPGDGDLTAEVVGHQLELQWDFAEDFDLLVGAAYRETELSGFSTEAELAANRQRLFQDGRSLSRQRRFRDYEAEHIVLRAELGGRFETGPLRHRLLLGVDYDAFDNSQVFLRSRPPVLGTNPSPQAGNVIDIFNPVYGRFPLPTPGPQTNRLDEQRARGAYIQDQIALFDDVLQVRLGARYDDFDQDSLNRANGSTTRLSDSRVSPQAGVVVRLDPDLSVYAAYGEGFRPNVGADVRGTVFQPEESRSSELGVKFALLDGEIEGTVAAFYLVKENVLTADPANPGFSVAIGEAESRGFELDLRGRLPGEINVFLSYAYVDAEVAKAGLDPNFGLAIREGDRLLNIPQSTLSLQASRDLALGEQTLTLGGGLLSVGERLGETATSFELPDYTLVRLFGRYAPSETIEFTAEINNLFDEEYYPNSFAQLWVAPGAPLNGSLAVRILW